MSFEDYSIDPSCLRILKSQKITTPTPVQAESIPIALEGRDVTSIAQTGTGKTLAFGLPSLTRIAKEKRGRTRMLVLTPTRELAIQVKDVLEPLGRALKLRTVCVYGGVGYEPQTKALRRGVDIVVATPGRLLDHLDRGNARFDSLSVLVLDEADRMLDMGFLPDIKKIANSVSEKRQTLMFSATFPREIARMASSMQRDPHRIEIGITSKPIDTIEQKVFTVAANAKLGLLTDLLREPELESTIVFTRTKHRTDRTAKALQRKGLKVQAIHGGRTQSQRQQAIDGFRRGKYAVLVATDVAARGLDVDGITHVINYDIPMGSDDYIHRVGRTGRAKSKGNAITFVSPEESKQLGSIERGIGSALPREDWEGAVAVVSHFKAGSKAPAGKSRSNNRNGSNNGSKKRNGSTGKVRNGNGRPSGNRKTTRSESSRRSESSSRSETAKPRTRRSKNFNPRRKRALKGATS